MKKLRILISTVLISTMVISLAGCGKDTKEEPTGDKNQTQQTSGNKDGKEDDKKDDKKGTYKKDPDLPKTLKAELETQSYWIDVPVGGITRNSTGWYNDYKEVFVIYDQFIKNTTDKKYNVDPSNIKTPDKVIDALNKQFLLITSHRLPSAKTYEISKKEDVKVNGWDMCRYEGFFNVDSSLFKDKKAKFVAYGVIKDGYPVYFAVIDRTNEQNKGEEIVKLADKIAKTFREVGVE